MNSVTSSKPISSRSAWVIAIGSLCATVLATCHVCAQSPASPPTVPAATSTTPPDAESVKIATDWKKVADKVVTIPTGSYPEDTIRALKAAHEDGTWADALEKYTTPTGHRVLDWLNDQTWFDEKLDGNATKVLAVRHKRQGNRFEILCTLKNDDGNERISAVFFFQNGVMKFHDIYMFNMKGVNYEAFLSAYH